MQTLLDRLEFRMFRLIKRKPAVSFDEQDFQAILKAHFRPGFFAAFYFAKSCGMRGDILSDKNNDDFIQALLWREPESIDCQGKEYGFSHFEEEVMTCIRSAREEMPWLRQISPIDSGKHRIPHSDQERLKALQGHCRKNNIKKLHNIFPDIDLAERVFQHVKSLRRNDLELLLAELKSRHKIVKKIFRPLRNSRINKYGDPDFGREFDEIQEFIDYAFNEDDFLFFWQIKPMSFLLDHIEEMLDENAPADEIPLNGIDFEHWCADRLREQGWIVAVSRASGDQGVDVMARRDGIDVAIQCKRYTNPIGNKAVQEAFTGAQNEDAGHSCVIGTGGFTPSAKQIASKTGVHLIDADDISLFSNLFGFEMLEPAEVPATNLDVDADTS